MTVASVTWYRGVSGIRHREVFRMNGTKYDYGEISEPLTEGEKAKGEEAGNLIDSHVFIIAWDSAGNRYAFGTTPKMLKERDDAERFKTCDLSRYPVGSRTGFSNRVVVIQTWVTIKGKGRRPYRTTVDDALARYDRRDDIIVLREL